MAELPSSQSNQPATARRPKAARLKCSAEPRYCIIKKQPFLFCQVVNDKPVLLAINNNLVKQ